MKVNNWRKETIECLDRGIVCMIHVSLRCPESTKFIPISSYCSILALGSSTGMVFLHVNDLQWGSKW